MNSSCNADKMLLFSPKTAAKLGLNEAIAIQQVHYWLSKSTNYNGDKYWVYNSYSEWQKQFPFWSRSTIIRLFRRLETEGIFVTGNFNKDRKDQTKWYSIDYEKLEEILSE